jgi:hypothetical protein
MMPTVSPTQRCGTASQYCLAGRSPNRTRRPQIDGRDDERPGAHGDEQPDDVERVGTIHPEAPPSREDRSDAGIAERNHRTRGDRRKYPLGGPVNEEIDQQRRQEQHRRIGNAFDQQQPQAQRFGRIPQGDAEGFEFMDARQPFEPEIGGYEGASDHDVASRCQLVRPGGAPPRCRNPAAEPADHLAQRIPPCLADNLCSPERECDRNLFAGKRIGTTHKAEIGIITCPRSPLCTERTTAARSGRRGSRRQNPLSTHCCP